MPRFHGSVISLPGFHGGQLAIHQNAARFNHICCGRRWGKTHFLARLAIETMLRGEYAGIFVPAYKFLSEIYREILDRVLPMSPQSSKTEGIIRLPTGGRADFWSLDNEAAGRGRKYHRVMIDEAAFAKDSSMSITWERAIMPTLVDYKGDAFAFSTPNGISDDNWFYQISQDRLWCKFQAPSSTNPFIPQDELNRIKETVHPLVWRQEFLAEFISWSGEQFFSVEKLLADGSPIDNDCKIHGNIFAVIDTAIKTGSDNDATAVTYFGKQPAYMYDDRKPRVFVLDWHIEQIEGGSLLDFIPAVYQRLEELSELHQCTYGGKGVWIEDKGSGSVILQQLIHKYDNAFPIESRLTQMGKDERALAASPYIASNLVKITGHAYNKTTKLKGAVRNHLLSQLAAFRIGDKAATKRADDLVDTFTYGIILGAGNTTGF